MDRAEYSCSASSELAYTTMLVLAVSESRGPLAGPQLDMPGACQLPGAGQGSVHSWPLAVPIPEEARTYILMGIAAQYDSWPGPRGSLAVRPSGASVP
jgi:hypothetical protein